MTADALKRIAMAHNWTPEPWQLKLADMIPPMAVFGIFKTAVLRDSFTWLGEHLYAKYLELEDPMKRKAAQQYLPDLARALGFPVHLVQPPAQPVGEIRPIFTTEEEIEAARKRHEQRLAQKLNVEKIEAREQRPTGRPKGYQVLPEEKIRTGMVKHHILRLRQKSEEVQE